MNYTELKDAVKDVVEIDIPDSVMNMLIKQAEQLLFNEAQPPALRKNQTAAVTAGNPYIGLPTDFLFPYSLAVISAGDHFYLLPKDVNFIREAYPDPLTVGRPQFYGIFDASNLILAPTPTSAYTVELHYAAYPESIVTATNTWLGTNMDVALLNGTLIQAIRFTKGEEADVKVYQAIYSESVKAFKQLSDAKLRQDAYRSGQVRDRVV